MKTIIKCTDGSIQVMTMVGDVDADAEIEKWKDLHPGKYESHREMPDDAIPADRRFRSAWADTTLDLVIDIDIDKARPLLSAEVDRMASAKRGIIVAGISPAEMASWPIKLAEATKYASTGLDLDAPNLAREAIARRVTLAALVAKVIAKADTLAAYEAGIAGTNGMHNDAIKQLATVEDMQGYDIEAGWPL